MNTMMPSLGKMIVRGIGFWKHDKVKKAVIKLFLKEQGLTKYEIEELEIQGVPYTKKRRRKWKSRGFWV